ncbi:MAG TPA: helix-turn-helix domain-containing protein [Allosphingosinicella sp.]|nr:helix-turn-helix domain-containing protein [Allosphingosinicella sp.]
MKKEDFDGLMEGMQQALAWARGEDVPGLRVHFPPGGDVAAIRRKTGLSQTAFAKQIGVSVATLRNWEQGRRCPEGPARVLLALLAKDPDIVRRMLAVAA